MSTLTVHHGEIVAIKRLNNSEYGNPRYDVTIYTVAETFTVRTKTDASLGYSITNHKIGTWGMFAINGRNQLEDFNPDKGE